MAKIIATGNMQLPAITLKGIVEVKRLTKDKVQARLQDWRDRLEQLMNTIEGWSRQYAKGYKVKRHSILQTNEELMQKFEIAPAQLPALSLSKGNQRIAFVPSSLWIIGANGRVNVTTNEAQYTLLDMGGESGLPSDWRIVSKDIKRGFVLFDQNVFQNILGDQPV